MRLIPWALFLLVFFVGVFLSPAIGPAWDEPDNMFSAGVYARDSSFTDQIYPLDRNLAHLPPVHNYVGLVFVWIRTMLGIPATAPNIITAFHWSAALFFALLVAYTFLFARLLGLSTPLSVAAALFTYLYPTLFGHGYSNTKDIAQASLFTVSLYYLVKKNLLAGAAVWGLALATKFNAVYVPIIWGIWGIRGIKGRRVIGVLGVGLVTAFLVWPYLWSDPIGRALEVVRYFTTVGQGYHAFWNGVVYRVGAGKALWWYPWANLVLVTPIPMLILAVIGGIRAIRERKTYGILLIWLVVPMLRAFLPSAAFYDGLRHFLEVLPAWALLAAMGLGELKKYSFFLAPFVVVQLLFINATYFPYSTGYYNFFAKDANVRFDRDIEALSVKEGVDYLHKKYGAIKLWSPIGGHLSWYYLTSKDQYVYSASPADSIILVNKSSHIRQSEFESAIAGDFVLDYEIRRGKGVFMWIYRKR